MAFISLRRKLLLGLLAANTFFALGMVAFAETAVRGKLGELLRDKGVAIARMVAEDCVNPVITERTLEIAMMFKDLQAAEADVLYAFILGENGRELVHTFPGGFPPGLRGAHPHDPRQPFSVQELLTDRGPVIDVAVPLLRGEAGVLHLGLSQEAIDREVNRIVLLILLFAVLALLLGSAAAIGFSNFISGPLLTLTDAAEAFGRGETAEPIAISSEDEVGELARVFNEMVASRRQAEVERERLIGELRAALGEVKTLRGFLPICSSCKKIRDDQGYWQQIESYVCEHTEAEFSHGICPECARRLYPQQWAKIEGQQRAEGEGGPPAKPS